MVTFVTVLVAAVVLGMALNAGRIADLAGRLADRLGRWQANRDVARARQRRERDGE